LLDCQWACPRYDEIEFEVKTVNVVDMTMRPPALKPATTGRVPVGLVLAAAVLVLAAGGLFIWSAVDVSAASAAHSHAAAREAAREVARQNAATAIADAAEAKAQAAALAQANEHATMAANGFAPGSSGVYYKGAKGGSCEMYLNCSYLEVAVTTPCPSGIYIAASLLSGNISIGTTNSITAGLPANGKALVRLNFSEQPDSVTITDAHCLG
jgi:hypothetical protein